MNTFGIFKLGGFGRIFVVIAVAWAVAFWVFVARGDLGMRWPSKQALSQVEAWIVGLENLEANPDSSASKMRRDAIAKLVSTGKFTATGYERDLKPDELSAYRDVISHGIAGERKEALHRALAPFVDSDSTAWVTRLRSAIQETPWWDFRGVRGIDAEELSSEISASVQELLELHRDVPSFPAGVTHRQGTGRATGLATDNDLAFAGTFYSHARSRWWAKPVFWLSAYFLSLLLLACAYFGGISIIRWISRGFHHGAA